MTAMNALSASLRFQGMLASCLCSEGIEPALLVNIQCQGVMHSEGIEPELLLSIQCQGVFHDAGARRSLTIELRAQCAQWTREE